jgi:hypothetical protein
MLNNADGQRTAAAADSLINLPLLLPVRQRKSLLRTRFHT